MNFIVHCVLPPTCYAASELLQWFPNITVSKIPLVPYKNWMPQLRVFLMKTLLSPLTY